MDVVPSLHKYPEYNKGIVSENRVESQRIVSFSKKKEFGYSEALGLVLTKPIVLVPLLTAPDETHELLITNP